MPPVVFLYVDPTSGGLLLQLLLGGSAAFLVAVRLVKTSIVTSIFRRGRKDEISS
jgi:hypothetical protein